MFTIRSSFIVLLRRYSSKSKKKQNVEEYLKRQSSDYYSKLAKEHSYRARSAFKLLAINEKHKIIYPGDVVVDIGAAPGSWSQVAAELVFDLSDNALKNKKFKDKNSGYVLGVDLQPLNALPHVEFIGQADITKKSTHEKIKEKLSNRMVDALISDMAPNPTGNSFTDHFRLIELCRLLVKLCLPKSVNYNDIDNNNGIELIHLKKDGKFLCKIFDGELTSTFVNEVKKYFKTVQIVKPIASRETSSEHYLLARTPRFNYSNNTEKS